MSKSTRRQTAEDVVAAFNEMDIDKIMSYRSDDCVRHILPSTLKLSPTSNDKYRAQLEQLKPIFSNFGLTCYDVIEDEKANRICMYLRARADTLAGEYVNEYMWTLNFDDSETKITRVDEFVDTVMNRDFWPKLKAAMTVRTRLMAGDDQAG
jgi:ketosteroid isomerase-like protein